MNREINENKSCFKKKNNKLLAILTKKKREKVQITKIRNESGTLLLILQKHNGL